MSSLTRYLFSTPLFINIILNYSKMQVVSVPIIVYNIPYVLSAHKRNSPKNETKWGKLERPCEKIWDN